MKPPKQAKTEFERIPKYDEWIEGTITDIEYDENHKRSYAGEEKVGPCVRFKLGLKGCEFPHRSKWMTFSYGEKANLYNRFLVPLLEDSEPYMDFDLDELKSFPIKTMWSADGDYDKLEMIRPLGEKLKLSHPKTEPKINERPYPGAEPKEQLEEPPF